MTMKKPTKKTLIIDGVGILVFAALLALDLLTKAWAVRTHPSQVIIPKMIKLTLVYNSGMAFSLFDDNRTAMIVVMILTCAIMLVIAFAFLKIKSENKFLKILLAVIEAGAVGNLVDRVMWLSGAIPGVRDFVDVSFFGFGVCNLADFFVSFGGVILVLYFVFFSADPLIPVFKKKKPKEKEFGGKEENVEPKAIEESASLEERSVKESEEEEAGSDNG